MKGSWMAYRKIILAELICKLNKKDSVTNGFFRHEKYILIMLNTEKNDKKIAHSNENDSIPFSDNKFSCEHHGTSCITLKFGCNFWTN